MNCNLYTLPQFPGKEFSREEVLELWKTGVLQNLPALVTADERLTKPSTKNEELSTSYEEDLRILTSASISNKAKAFRVIEITQRNLSRIKAYFDAAGIKSLGGKFYYHLTPVQQKKYDNAMTAHEHEDPFKNTEGFKLPGMINTTHIGWWNDQTYMFIQTPTGIYQFPVTIITKQNKEVWTEAKKIEEKRTATKAVLLAEKKITDAVTSTFIVRQIKQHIQKVLMKTFEVTFNKTLEGTFVSKQLEITEQQAETAGKILRETLDEFLRDQKTVETILSHDISDRNALIQELMEPIRQAGLTEREMKALERFLQHLPGGFLGRLFLWAEGRGAISLQEEVTPTQERVRDFLSTLRSQSFFTSSSLVDSFYSISGAFYRFIELTPELEITKEEIKQWNDLFLKELDLNARKRYTKFHLATDFIIKKATEKGLRPEVLLIKFTEIMDEYAVSAYQFAAAKYPNLMTVIRVMRELFSPIPALSVEGTKSLVIDVSHSDYQGVAERILLHELGHGFDYFLASNNKNLQTDLYRFLEAVLQLPAAEQFQIKNLKERGYSTKDVRETLPELLGLLYALTVAPETQSWKERELHEMYALIANDDGTIEALFDEILGPYLPNSQEDRQSTLWEKIVAFFEWLHNLVFGAPIETLKKEDLPLLEKLMTLMQTRILQEENFGKLGRSGAIDSIINPFKAAPIKGKVMTVKPEKIFSGKQTLVSQTEKEHKTFYKGDGVYDTGEGTIKFNLLGQFLVVGQQVGLLMGGGQMLTKEEYAVKAGFISWEELQNSKVFPEEFLSGKRPLYTYEVSPVGDTPPTVQVLQTTQEKVTAEQIYSVLGETTASENVVIKPWSELKDAKEAVVEGATYKWSRYSDNSYEVSSQGDKRFSALYAELKDGRTIEEAYQLDVKGYRSQGNDWKLGKGKKPIRNITREQQWNEYKELWRTYLNENPGLLEDLRAKAKGRVLTDQFASTDISQARALAEILNEQNSSQIISTRIQGTNEHFGNPFSSDEKVLAQNPRLIKTNSTKESVEKYIGWVLNELIENKNVIFEEEQTTGYRNRTIKNASADATIALAVDFNSAGERLTKSSVLQQGKKYIPIDANRLEVIKEIVDKIVEQLNSINAKTLNIAGNGIYTMKGKYTQQQVDDFTYELLKAVIESPNLKIKIESIRTGGQTGFDEAGAKAGIRLSIPTTILAPKGWTFRDITGKDISNEQQFKDRFTNLTQQIEPQRREWIREQLKSGKLKGLPILYYKELGEPSHATALDYLINKYDWSKSKEEASTTHPSSTPPPSVETAHPIIQEMGAGPVTFVLDPENGANYHLMGLLTNMLVGKLLQPGNVSNMFFAGGVGKTKLSILYNELRNTGLLQAIQMGVGRGPNKQYLETLIKSDSGWAELVAAHLAYLQAIGTFDSLEESIAELLEEQEPAHKDNVSSRSSFYYAPETFTRDIIKLLVKSLIRRSPANAEGVYTPIMSEDNLPYPVDYNRVMTLLNNNLAGLPAEWSALRGKLVELIQIEPALSTLLSWLDQSGDSWNEHLRTAFVVSFAMDKATFVQTYIQSSTGDIFPAPVTLSTAEERLIQQWKGFAEIQSIDSKTLFTALAENEKRTSATAKAINFLHLLGINLAGIQMGRFLIPGITEEVHELENLKNLLALRVKHPSSNKEFSLEGIIYEMNKYLKPAIEGAEDRLKNLFSKKGATATWMKMLANMLVKYQKEVSTLSHYTADGNLAYSITLNSYISSIVNRINHVLSRAASSDERRELLQTHVPELFSDFSKDSIVIRGLIEGNMQLSLTIEEGLQDISSNSNVVFSELSPIARLITSIANTLQGFMSLPRQADRVRESGFNIGRNTHGSYNIFTGDLSGAVNILLNYLVTELEITRNSRLGKYDHVQFLGHNTKNLGVFVDIIPQHLVEDAINGQTNLEQFVFNNKDLSAALRTWIKKEAREVQRLLLKAELLKPREHSGKTIFTGLPAVMFDTTYWTTQTGSVLSVEEILELYVSNAVIGYIEGLKLFIGDPRQFGSATDAFKRFGMFNSTKQLFRVDSIMNDFLAQQSWASSKIRNGLIKIVAATDPLLDAAMLKEIEKIFRKEAEVFEDSVQRQEFIEDSLAAFQDIEGANSLGFILLDEWKEMLERAALWSVQHDRVFDRLVRGEHISISDPDFVFINVLKTQGVGIEPHDPAIPGRQGIKHCLFVLAPEMVKNTKLEKLYDWMTANGVGIYQFGTGFKFGAQLNSDLQLNPYETEDKTEINTQELVIQALHYRDIGLQVNQEGPPTNHIQTVIQAERTGFSNLYQDGELREGFDISINELVGEYNHLRKKLIREARQTLTGDLEIYKSQDKYKIGNRQAFVAHLYMMLGRDILDPNIERAVRDLLNSDVYLDETPLNKKLNSIALALFNNRIIRERRPGTTNVQISSHGWEVTGALRPPVSMSVKTVNGQEIIGNEVIVSLPPEFYPIYEAAQKASRQMKEGPSTMEILNNWVREAWNGQGPLDVNILIWSDHRVPNQALASSDIAFVTGFLPPMIASTVIVPIEILARAQSDFDVDKLFTYVPKIQYQKEGAKFLLKDLTEWNTAGAFNRLMQIKIQLATQPANRRNYLMPVSDTRLKRMAGENKAFLAKRREAGREELVFRLSDIFPDAESLIDDILTGKRTSVTVPSSLLNTFSVPAGQIVVFKDRNHKFVAGMILSVRDNGKNIPVEQLAVTENVSPEKLAAISYPTTTLFLTTRITKLPSVRTSWTSVISPIANLEMFERFMASKAGIEIVAPNISAHVHAQLAGTTATSSITVFPHNKNSQNQSILGGVEAIDHYWITETLSALMTGLVDAVKNPYLLDLNIVNQTLPVAITMIRAGMSMELIRLLLFQPVLMDYLGQAAIHNNPVLSGLGLTQKTDWQLIQSILTKYKTEKSPNDLLYMQQRKGAVADMEQTINRYTQRVSELLGTSSEPYRELKEMAGKVSFTKEELAFQVMILDEYLRLRDFNRNSLLKFNRFVRPDSGRIKSLFHMDNQLGLSRGIEGLTNTEAVLHSFVGGIIEQIQWSRQVLEPLYLSQLEGVREMLQQVIKLATVTAKTQNGKDQITARVLQHFVSFIIMTAMRSSQKSISYLGVTPEDISRIAFGPQSIGKQLSAIQADPQHSLHQNKLIRQMITIPSDMGDKVRLFSLTLNPAEINDIRRAYREIQLSDPQFAEDLVKLCLVTHGIELTTRNPLALIPYENVKKIVHPAILNFSQHNPQLAAHMVTEFARFLFRKNPQWLPAIELKESQYDPRDTYPKAVHPSSMKAKYPYLRHPIKGKTGTFGLYVPVKTDQYGNLIYQLSPIRSLEDSVILPYFYDPAEQLSNVLVNTAEITDAFKKKC